jgi:hypothetical protein
MKKIKQGAIIRIPLLNGYGFAYAKFLDLAQLTDPTGLGVGEIIKVYQYRTIESVSSVNITSQDKYLIAPIGVAGLRHALKLAAWQIVGEAQLDEQDYIIPDFKGGNETQEEIEKGEWFIYRQARTNTRKICSYSEVKYLQPFGAYSTHTIELLLTMYHIVHDGKRVEQFFDLTDEENQWCSRQVFDSPALP